PPKSNPRTLTYWLLWSPDGKTLALAAPDGKGVHLLDVERGAVTRTLVTNDAVYGAAFSPDGKLFAAGGHDREGNNYFGRLWEVGTGKELCRFANGHASLRALAFAPDGKTLAGGGDDAPPRPSAGPTRTMRRGLSP